MKILFTIKLAFRELFQVYYIQFKAIRKKWRVSNGIKIANSRFQQTGEQHFVVPHARLDCEVLSKHEVDRRIALLKKRGDLPKSTTMLQFQKECIYFTNPKIYSGNCTVFGKPVERINQNKK